MNTQRQQISDEIIQRVREEAKHAASPEMIPRIVFDVLSETTTDPAHLSRLRDVKMLLAEAYRAAGVSARSLARKSAVA